MLEPPSRVTPVAAACACVSLLYWPGALAGGALSYPRGAAQEVAARMKVMYERVAGIDVHKDMTAPRGALLYSRLSREEFGGYSWV